MCCFSGKVRFVADTKIFARFADASRQLLIYKMRFGADTDLAMVLPIPTPTASPENDLRFIDLKEYSNIFDDMHRAFPVPIMGRAPLSRAMPDAKSAEKKLDVVEVGDYIASFVPTLKDFSRLDEKFRIAQDSWDKLPSYRDFGFAVFQLKAGNRDVHPMAFEFTSRHPSRLFFPTVHIHDNKVHERARFDHTLYCQHAKLGWVNWQQSTGPASKTVNIAKAKGIVAADQPLYRKTMRGVLTNEDIYV